MKKLIATMALAAFTNVAFADGLVATSTPPATPQIQAQVTETPMTGDKAADLITINRTPTPLSSKLKKRYSAYKVTLTSNYPGTLRVMSANIVNGVPGSVAYNSMETSKAWALLGLLLFPVGLVLIGLPVLTTINVNNHKAENESIGFSNQIPTLDLASGQPFTFTALVPSGQNPQISFALKDPKTELSFVKNSL